LRINNN